MYTCGFRINANLVKESSFRIKAKLVKEELMVFYVDELTVDWFAFFSTSNLID